jgi:hypothetical protein
MSAIAAELSAKIRESRAAEQDPEAEPDVTEN